MALFTGKGDGGTSTLFDSGRALGPVLKDTTGHDSAESGARHDSAKSGARVTKSSPIFETLGQLDELNTLIGWCKVAVPKDFLVLGRAGSEVLHEAQDHLFTIQAEVAGAQKSVPQSSVEALGMLINGIEKELPPIKTFLVPGGTEFSARCDITRAVSRRAERRLVMLHESGDRIISESSRAYANRLSSLFYALTRLANHREGIIEHPPSYKGA